MQSSTLLLAKITKHLHWAEAFFLIALGIGILINRLNAEGITLIKVSLTGLAGVYFLYAYKPLEIEPKGNEKFGFNELLAWSIIPKIAWISASVSIMGILFYIMSLGNEGYKQVLMIGGLSLFIAVLSLGFLTISGVKNIRAVLPVLYRGIPLLLIDIYILFG